MSIAGWDSLLMRMAGEGSSLMSTAGEDSSLMSTAGEDSALVGTLQQCPTAGEDLSWRGGAKGGVAAHMYPVSRSRSFRGYDMIMSLQGLSKGMVSGPALLWYLRMFPST